MLIVGIKHTKTCQDASLKEAKNLYNDEFFEKFSIRDWVSWDTESGLILFYEDSEIIKKNKIKSGLIENN